MNSLKLVLGVLALAVVQAGAIEGTQVTAYLVQNGVDLSTVDMVGLRSPGIAVIDGVLSIWRIPGLAQPEEADLPSVEDAEGILEEYRQARKSALHKAADNALITVLIRGGFLPVGTTEVPAGTEASVTTALLQAEVLDPTNTTIQALSTKLARIKTIIKEAGGIPDDARVH